MPDATPLPVAIVFATMLVRELEMHHAGEEHSERLVDAIGGWLNYIGHKLTAP
jgi:hypothetical protein